MRNYDYYDLKDVATDAEHKEQLLKMLVEFDKFCEENGLTYYLSGGTLLGAIRHKGFIPWDDDIDVNMPRPDCEKLMKLSGGRIGDFELIPPNFTNKYHAYHWKLYNDSILVSKRLTGGKAKRISKKVYPIFMDIFPIEGLPATEEENIRHYTEIKNKKRRANHAWGKTCYKGRNPYKIFRNRMARLLYSRIGIKKLFNEVIEVATSIPYEESNYIGVMMTNVHTTEERVIKFEYSPVIKMEFEGHMFSCPAGYHTYLCQLYGSDYMKLLPAHKRISKHSLVPFIARTSKEREDYLKEMNKSYIEMEIDGEMISYPAEYETYLCQLFGDNYKESLPVFKRITKYGLVSSIVKIVDEHEQQLKETYKSINTDDDEEEDFEI